MWAEIKALFLGVSKDPQIVAGFRTLILYAIPALVALLTAWAATITDPRYYALVMAALSFMRLVEGAIDRYFKARQNDPRPTPPAGASDPAQLRDLVDQPPRGID